MACSNSAIAGEHQQTSYPPAPTGPPIQHAQPGTVSQHLPRAAGDPIDQTQAGELPLSEGKHISFIETLPKGTNAGPTAKPGTSAADMANTPELSNSRFSASNKRDSGLVVEDNHSTTTSLIGGSSAPVPCPSPVLRQSSSIRQFKRGPPSLVGGASIGGVSAAPSTILTPEDELLSRRVRSLYDSGSEAQSSYSKHSRRGAGGDTDTVGGAVPGGRKRHSRGLRSSLVVTDEEGGLDGAYLEINGGGAAVMEEDEGSDMARMNGHHAYRESTGEAPPGQKDSVEMEDEKEDMLWAGGIEDWENVDGKDIDRYGFISPEGVRPGHQRRVSTSLYLQSNMPKKARRNHHLRLLVNPFDSEKPAEMLQSPALQHKDASKEKEIERAKKWRAMAVTMTASKTNRWRRKETGKQIEGSGSSWKFITTDAKLISRTWKGIPDCWRAAAWHAFLTASAEKKGNCLADDELREIYQELVDRGCADDVQIDLDVPRTINSHIMFRRRYSGGQRLLFRVLHCLSLYFSEIGYVQGMASIAATLLCYYDEETTFVMLVRMWELRGLGKLYQPGFGGLMEALDEFQSKWLRDGPVGQRLDALGIGPTAYGTRWYLTLFNYSIPFPAQLRVWDVFMLLGDSDPPTHTPHGSLRHRNPHHFPGLHFGKGGSGSLKSGKTGHKTPRGGNSMVHIPSPGAATAAGAGAAGIGGDVGLTGALDILHATSAALIDGMKDILLQSDFENAMKALTSWIPVKDEELLMKVAKAEWKTRRRRKAYAGVYSSGDGGSDRGGGMSGRE